MTTLFWDSFTESTETPLTSHAPDVGSGWVNVYNTTGGEWVVDAQLSAARLSVDANSTGIATCIDPSPTSNEYDISFTLVRGEGQAESGTKPVGVFFRRSNDQNMYLLQILPNAHAQNSEQLFVRLNGTWTQLASVDTPETIPVTYDIVVRDAAKQVYKASSLLLATTNNSVEAAGTIGITNGNYNPAGGHARKNYAFGEFAVSLLGAISVNLDPLALQMAPQSVAIDNQAPVTVSLAPATLYLQTPTASVQAGAVSVALQTQTMTLSAADLAITQPVLTELRPLTLGLRAQQVAVSVPAIEFSWYILVDWADDGLFMHPESDVTARVQRASWRNGMRQAYREMADEAEAAITLINTDGRYSPDNSASPLAGLLVPGRRVLIMYTLDDYPVPMYAGFVETIDPWWQEASGAYTGKMYVTLNCVGWKQALEDANVSVGLQYNKEAQAILQPILNSLGAVTDFQGGLLVHPVYGGDGTKRAWQVAEELTAAERGRFFQARSGAMAWRNRHWLIDNHTVAGVVSYTTGPYKPAATELSGGKYLSNSIRVQAYQRAVTGSSEVLWELQAPLEIPPGATREIVVSLERDNQSRTPAGTTTVTVTGVEFAAGSATISAVAIGSEARITITNAGIFSATLTAMKLMGVPTVTLHPLAVEVQGETVQEVGVRGHRVLNLRALSSYDEARQIALYEIYRRGKPTGSIDRLTWRRRGDGVDNAHLLAWEIGTRIAVDNPSSGAREEYWVIGEEHSIDGPVHEATLCLEPADTQRYWLLGVPGYSELGQTTVVGY